jgi:hypothetical protein
MTSLIVHRRQLTKTQIYTKYNNAERMIIELKQISYQLMVIILLLLAVS